MAIQIEIYQTASGTLPYSDWLRALKDQQARARIRTRIARVQTGNLGDCKSVGGGVFELRVDYGPGYRVYLARRGQTMVLLLCGGDKRMQTRDIQRAGEYLADYEMRNKHA